MKKIFHSLKTLALVFCVVVGIFALYQHYAPVKGTVAVTPAYTQKMSIGVARLRVAVADTHALRAQGLSGTLRLAEDEAMLFVFEQPQRPRFWMKNMKYPIDILWIGQTYRVLDITENADPKDFPQTYMPASEVMYVLEVPAGFVKANGIRVGSVLVRK